MGVCPECEKTFAESVETCPEHGVRLVPDSVFANVDRDLAPDTHVGDYVIESKLGEGSFGKVYRAVHPVIGKRVAIKVLSRALSGDPHAVSRFITEARAVVEIGSPNIVDIYSMAALADGRQYYVMELLDGDSLDGLLRERGRLDPPEAMRILVGMGGALAAAHGAGIVHRDLKPENVFIAFDTAGQPVPKLLDFGVAKLLGDRQLSHRTGTGALVGTPTYMAPEQALGLDVDHRADIYALGVVAFEMLAGRPPFAAGSLIELIRKHTSEPPPLLSSMRPALGDAFDSALVRMLAKDPAERPQSADECVSELRAAAESAGIDAPAPAYLSLRPPPAVPSGPRPATPSWDADTVRSTESDAVPAGSSAGRARDVTVGGTAGHLTDEAMAKPRSSATLWGTLALLAVAAAVAGVLALREGPESDRSVDVAVAAGSRQAPADSTQRGSDEPASGTAQPTPATIELQVETAVPAARVLLAGEEIGRAPGPLSVPRGTELIEIEVAANGYESAVIKIVPDRNQTLRPTLRRSVSSRPPPTKADAPEPTATASSSAEVPSELDVPSFVQFR